MDVNPYMPKPVEWVRCDASATPHPFTETCEAPHNAGYGGQEEAPRIPSMSAAETLDPREAVFA